MDVSDFLAQVILWVLILCGIIYFYFCFAYTYWARRGINYLPPTFPWGNIGASILAKISYYEQLREIYNKIKGPCAGTFSITEPVLILKDPDLIKAVLVKDFSYFQDRGLFLASEREPLTMHLFTLGGQKWKDMRVKLSPTFTSGKMKMMFQAVVDCAEELNEVLKEAAVNRNSIEIKEYAACYTTDVIASVAFGIQGNTLKNPDAEFRRFGKKVFSSDLETFIRNILQAFAPFVLKVLPYPLINSEVTKFVNRMVKETVSYREENKIIRNDFLQLLIQLKNKREVSEENVTTADKYYGNDSKHEGITLDEIAAEVFLFYSAGFETSSTTMQFCLYELALNLQLQQKIQTEIDNVLNKYGKLTYEGLQEMQLLENTVSETLRKYPPLAFLNRVCTADYKLPNLNATLKKGTKVIIPCFGLHYDQKYYPDPEKFDPDRFTYENKKERPSYTYLPFGEGPRNCIGMRMGKMSAMTGLIFCLKKYTFEPCNETENPIKLDKKNFLITPENGIKLRISLRTI